MAREKGKSASKASVTQGDIQPPKMSPPALEGGFLTTNQGLKISDNHNSLKAGVRGPTLLEDFVLREKITSFDHERIPERVVHARGAGAFGIFECTKNMSKFTSADFSANRERKLPCSFASPP